MTETKKQNWKYWVQLSFWIVAAVGTVVLLVSAIRSKDSKGCKAVEINIAGSSSNFFIDKKDIKNILTADGSRELIGKRIPDFDLEKMEEVLEKNVWIKNAELFFDNNMVLQVKVEEREPVARVFTTSGKSFYIDKEGDRLPLSENFSARVPMFTSFPTEAERLNKTDSIFLQQVKTVSEYILNDAFWMAQIEQVDINSDRHLEMIPKLGDHIIRFGEAKETERKFHQLDIFYRQVSSQLGWNKYSIIDVQYNKQVVATKKGFAGAAKLDSVQIKMLVKEMMKSNRQSMNDTSLAVALSKPSVSPVLKSTNENAVPALNKPVNETNSKPLELSPKPKPKSTPASVKPNLTKDQNPNPKPPTPKGEQGKNEKPKPKAVMKKS
jgi:cell division protein FtsQ